MAELLPWTCVPPLLVHTSESKDHDSNSIKLEHGYNMVDTDKAYVKITEPTQENFSSMDRKKCRQIPMPETHLNNRI